jgi:hypothetical protein
MRRSLVVGAVGVALGGGAFATVAVAQQDTAPPSPPSGTLTFTERQGYFKFVDNGKKGPGIGDSYVFSSDLLSGGKRIGTLRATCVATTRHGDSSECIGTFFLPDGQINGQVGQKGDTKTTVISIVGGTGHYAGARGVISSTSRGRNSKFSDDIVTFMP